MAPTQTGFLTDYSGLTPLADTVHSGIGFREIEVRLPRPEDLAEIDSFYIEPVQWLAKEDDFLSGYKYRRREVSASLESSLRENLGAIRPIVATPGPRTARVRAAVTDIASARIILNVICSIVVGPISNGGASVEAEIKAPDGRQIAAVDGGDAGGLLDFVGFYTYSGHPKDASNRLAGELTDAIRSVEVR